MGDISFKSILSFCILPHLRLGMMVEFATVFNVAEKWADSELYS